MCTVSYPTHSDHCHLERTSSGLGPMGFMVLWKGSRLSSSNLAQVSNEHLQKAMAILEKESTSRQVDYWENGMHFALSTSCPILPNVWRLVQAYVPKSLPPSWVGITISTKMLKAASSIKRRDTKTPIEMHQRCHY